MESTKLNQNLQILEEGVKLKSLLWEANRGTDIFWENEVYFFHMTIQLHIVISESSYLNFYSVCILAVN